MALIDEKAIKEIEDKIRDIINWVEISKNKGDINEDTAQKMRQDLEEIAVKLGLETL